MKTPHIEIKTNGVHAEIFIDGKKINGVRGYEPTHEASNIPILQLHLKATDVTVEGLMLPELPEPYKDFYVSKRKLVEAGIISDTQAESM